MSKGTADWFIVFAEQADLSPAYVMDWEERGELVYHTLQEVAQRSQGQVKVYLDGRGLPYHTFIAGNELCIWASGLLTANSLAAMPEVVHIRALRTYFVDPILSEEPEANTPQAGFDWGILSVRCSASTLGERLMLFSLANRMMRWAPSSTAAKTGEQGVILRQTRLPAEIMPLTVSAKVTPVR